MSFTLRQILSAQPDAPRVTIECPTGKHAFASKRDAADRARQINHTQHTNMAPFRCGYCDRYHLGHKRGAIL